jgi:hypothetical protein
VSTSATVAEWLSDPLTPVTISVLLPAADGQALPVNVDSVSHDRPTMVQVLRGHLLMAHAAACAVDHLWRDGGSPQFGTRYRLCTGANNPVKVIEITLAASQQIRRPSSTSPA